MSHDEDRSHDHVPRYARLAARALVAARRLEPDAPAPGEREAAIGALAGVLATRPARVVRRRVIIGLGAAAVAVLVLGLVQLGRGGRITARLDSGPLLSVGTLVRADRTDFERSISMSLSTGTRLRLSDAGRVMLAELGPRQHLVLESGRLWANVAPLARHHRFLIATPDTEIEVRGTAFEVVVAPEPSSCGGGVTQVKVSEGLVTVRRGAHLWQVAAGQSWPDACPPPSPRSSVQAVPEPAGIGDLAAKAKAVPEADSPLPRTRSLVSRRKPVAVAGTSSLREQNDLFAVAMEARRRGDVAAARRALDDLLARFPFGALAESARRELAALRSPRTSVPDPPM